MKKNLIMMMAVTAFVTVSCKKEKAENPQEPQQTVSGFYTGKINFNPESNDYANNYGILFKQNGTARVYNMAGATDTSALLSIAKMDGTWLQNGGNLQVNYKPIGSPITVTAAVNKAATDVNGTWGFNGETKGKFYLNKK